MRDDKPEAPVSLLRTRREAARVAALAEAVKASGEGVTAPPAEPASVASSPAPSERPRFKPPGHKSPGTAPDPAPPRQKAGVTPTPSPSSSPLQRPPAAMGQVVSLASERRAAPVSSADQTPSSGASRPQLEPPASSPATITSAPSSRPGLLRTRRDSPTPPDAAPASCLHCGGSGYVLHHVGEYARARLCECRSDCATCGGRGYVLRMTGPYLTHDLCSCQNLKRRVERFNQASVPSHYTFKDLGNFEPNAATLHVVSGISKFVAGYPADRMGLLLIGPPGVGKTHLAAGIVKELTLNKGVPCLFKDFFLLISEVKEAFEQNRFESEILRPLTEVEVLVVDELGKGRTYSDWENGLLDQIICRRYNQLKTTILTTNFPLDNKSEDSSRPVEAPVGRPGSSRLGNLSARELMPTLEERIGERIFSRLKQMCTIHRIQAADYRRTHTASGERSRR